MEHASVGLKGASKAPSYGFATLAHSNLKSHDKVAAAQAHNLREMPCPDARAEGHDPVELLPEMGGIDYVDRVAKIMDDHGCKRPADGGLHKVHKGATLAFEDVYSASPEYWNRNGNWKEKTAAEILADPLVARCIALAKRRHGTRLFSVTIHLDEETPHIHVLSVALHKITTRGQGRKSKDPNKVRPLVEKWTLCAGSKVRGGGWSLCRAQTLWAEAVSDLGLERGVETSKLDPEERKAHRDAKHPKSSMLEKRRREEHEAKMAEAQARIDLANDIIAREDEIIAEAAAKGQTRADQIVTEAETKALRIVLAATKPIADAQMQADRIKTDAIGAAERAAKAITDGADERVRLAVAAAVEEATDRAKADAEAKARAIVEQAQADADAVRLEAAGGLAAERKRVADEKAEAAKATAAVAAECAALEAERDGILQKARDDASEILLKATHLLEDREAKVDQQASELDGREAGIKAVEDRLEADRQVARDLSAAFGNLARKVDAALAPLQGFLDDYRAASVADKVAMGPKADKARAVLNSDAVRDYQRIIERAKLLASGQGRSGG
jgi:hypothetical protein